MKNIKIAPFGEIPQDLGYVPADLLEQIPSLMLLIVKSGYFPSVEVLNDLFSKGEFDSGMSGGVCWERFYIEDDSWLILRNTIAERYKVDYKEPDGYSSISKYDHWVEEVLKYLSKTK
ncbi:hypothetical protein [Neptuniibacter sp. QD34_54]|uniref:hypothetical protein n=1 Tax=Neptuniibacter sp. QD34_54 TaxID=3398208 RepID=UPI0039F4DDCE